MRSRYSAYALGGYGDYLYDTWYASDTISVSRVALNYSNQDWVGLEIIDKSQQGHSAEVEFKAYFINEDKQPDFLHERSTFIRENGQWLYVSGELFS